MERRERKVSVVVPMLRTWWLKIKQHPAIAAIVIVALIALAVFVFAAHTEAHG
jgi:hypothetical protein